MHIVQIVSFSMMAVGILGLLGLVLLARYAPDCSDKQ